MPHLRIYGHPGVVTDAFMRARSEVEQGSLPTVRVANECYTDRLTASLRLFQCSVRGQGVVFRILRVGSHTFILILFPFLLLPLLHFINGYNLYLISLTMSQTDLISHDLILHWVTKRRIQEHLHLLPFDETHLYDSFSEAPVSRDFNDDSGLTRS